MDGEDVTRRPAEWALLLLGWLLLAAPSGAVMFAITTFLFAFSSQADRLMGPLVRAGPWVVGLGALLVGGAVLASTRSLPRALWAVLGSIAVAWPVAVVVYWVVSFRLGLNPPRFGF